MTLKEIAAQAGVSIATVSRVLNHPDHKCSSDELKEKIWDIARKGHYIQNESAKNLKQGTRDKAQKIEYIDVLITRGGENAADGFFREMFHDIRSSLINKNCILDKLWLYPTFSDMSRKSVSACDKLITSMIKGRSVKNSGLIILGKCEETSLKRFIEEYRAVVSCNRNSGNYLVDEVTCDGRHVAEIAIDYLVQLGHRRIAYVGDCHGEKRYEGYQAAMFHYNLTPDIRDIIEVETTEAEGFRVMQELMNRDPDDAPTAVYAAADTLAIGMLRCLNQSRNRYYSPSIIGSDDIEEAQFTQPMLTTVHIPRREMGKFAVDLLLDRLRGGHKTSVRLELQGHLVVRGSCASPDMSYQLEYYI